MPRLRAWESVVAAASVVAFWVIVLALPERGPAWPDWIRWVMGAPAIVAIVFGCAGVIYSVYKVDMQKIGLYALVLLAGALVGVVSVTTRNELDFSSSERLAVGVGGTALACLIYGVTRFDTVRAAASVPVVVMLIGVTTWPDSSSLIAEDVRKQIIQWMGVVLAAAGASEAAKQIGVANAKAKATNAADVVAAGDLAARSADGDLDVGDS